MTVQEIEAVLDRVGGPGATGLLAGAAASPAGATAERADGADRQPRERDGRDPDRREGVGREVERGEGRHDSPRTTIAVSHAPR